MEDNVMRKSYFYKGYIVDYTGVPDEENPIRIFPDPRSDTYRIVISGSISQFLTDRVAEWAIDIIERCEIKEIRAELDAFLGELGLRKEPPQAKWSDKFKSELSEILNKNKL